MGSARAGVPKPGPAKLTPSSSLDEWLEEAKQCHYLPEPVMKELCEMVKEVLMEGKSCLRPWYGFVGLLIAP
jgi:serine/threonine-protein phosphatase PP1-1